MCLLLEATFAGLLLALLSLAAFLTLSHCHDVVGPSSRLAAEAQTAAAPKDKGLAHGPHGCGSLADLGADAETEAILSQTVQQLQELMRQSSE